MKKIAAVFVIASETQLTRNKKLKYYRAAYIVNAFSGKTLSRYKYGFKSRSVEKSW
jgi:hypothetical protein